jgi:hypothetical protein
MIKALVFSILIMFLISTISADIIINEVEMNPIDGSGGKEWIELYNDGSDSVNISGWTINDSLKKRYTIQNEIIIQSKEYYVIELNSTVLNNDGDNVTLYDNSGNKIYETFLLKDEAKNDLTNQLCSSKWKFVNSTKGKENNCKEEIADENNSEENITAESNETETNTTLVSSETKTTKEEGGTYTPKAKTETVNLTPISLNAQNIKSENNKEVLKKNLAFYGVITFCAMFGGLFLFKQIRRKNQNEFR